VTAVEHFHNYLYGTKIKIFTDHAPLTHLLTKKNPHPRMERWMLRLKRYELEFFHKAGKDNVVADMLSRLLNAEDINENSADDYLDVIVAGVNKTTETPQESTVPDNQRILVVEGEDVSCKNSSVVGRDSEQLINEQDQDEDIRWIMNRIKDYGHIRPKITNFANKDQRAYFREFENLKIKNNLLYRLHKESRARHFEQLVLPKASVERIINQIHAGRFSGHLGISKTWGKVNERFYRPNLKDKIREYIKACDVCQKTKITISSPKAFIRPIFPHRINQIVATDFAGPFRETVRKNKYLLVITDLYGKWLELIPTPNKETMTASKAIVEH